MEDESYLVGVQCNAYVETFKDAQANGPYLTGDFRCRVCNKLAAQHPSMPVAPIVPSRVYPSHRSRGGSKDSGFHLDCVFLMKKEVFVRNKVYYIPVDSIIKLPNPSRPKSNAYGIMDNRSRFRIMQEAGLVAGYPAGIDVTYDGKNDII